MGLNGEVYDLYIKQWKGKKTFSKKGNACAVPNRSKTYHSRTKTGLKKLKINRQQLYNEVIQPGKAYTNKCLLVTL